ncbi:MAG: Rhodococcus phage Weasels2 [Pseudomonadota bacterium]|jgi:hypothetical protein
MSNQNTSSASGVSITGLLGVLFVGLKLTGYISWPWIWVLSPFWIPVAVLGLAVFIFAIFCGIGKN